MAVRVWETRLGKLFEAAKIQNGHAHMFPGTIAVELLLACVPMERISVLLRHSSIHTTERHYRPWVRSRQEQHEADIARAWTRDRLVLLETEGTQQAHGEVARPN